MENTLLEVKDLRTYFHTKKGDVHAVDGVDFSVDKGKTLCIVGESGCGKSVTSLSIMQLIDKKGEIISGQVNFQGKDLLHYREEEIRQVRGNKISMIFQEPMTSLNPVFTIGRQVGEPLILHRGMSKKAAKKEAVELLTRVGIPRADEVVNEYPHQLSGGMRQRVMIAMALACEPELLIADEPTTALDVTIQAQILELMNELQEKYGMSIVFITHDLGVVAEMADHVVVMYAGRIVEEADSLELYDNPMHPYTIGLLGSIPDIDNDKERLANIDGVVPNPLSMPKGCPFHPRCEKATELCKEKLPELREVVEGHKVSCLLYEEGER
ncbi:ABC transporter ATP-binding protein [Vallitalea okinawensis]|uniref:ABC transporter ATP-binding protein n=1 Tax=Vallitalea okinawensis TaxID=2078660 RepID=UPI000CFDAFFA|nr:ABC transporter ATP-binding protein [Vallitalea okinawensis]